jgi:hypothetical protein
MTDEIDTARLSLSECLLASLKLMEEDFPNEDYDEIKKVILKPDEINVVDLQYVIDEGNTEFSFQIIMKKKDGK